MTQYTVHPVFGSDHTMEIEAASRLEAACKYLMERPVKKPIIVSDVDGAFHIIEIAEIVAQYPDINQLLEQTTSADQEAITAKEKEARSLEYRKAGKRKIIIGSTWLGVGLAITIATFIVVAQNNGEGLYVVATGPIAYGIYKLVDGLSNLWCAK